MFDTLKAEGFVEKVPACDINTANQSHYIPWHAVLREESKTTPVRIVHNASKKGSNGLSLNECQLAGPNLYPDLQGLLISWRKHAVAIMCDISKMFYRIGVIHKQRDLHRFFYRSSDDDILAVYRYLVWGEILSIYC